MHGLGKSYSEDGNQVYEGDHYESKRHGQGTLTNKDGSRYEGEWSENMMHGHGTLYEKDGKTVQFKGEFIRGTPADVINGEK